MDVQKQVDRELQARMEIPLAERYRAAANELNQRINARQISYLGHATATAALLKLFADEFQAGPPKPLSSSHDILLLFGPSIVSLAFSCWIRSQDLTVGMLSTFCRISEERSVMGDREIPSWHSAHQGWQKISMKHREWTEIAFIMLNTLLAGIATAYVFEAEAGKLTELGIIASSLNQFVLGLSSWMVLSIAEFRRRLLRMGFGGGRLVEPPEASPHPISLMAFVALAAVVGIVTGWLLNKASPKYLQSYLPCAVILAFAIFFRCVVLRLTSYLRKRSGTPLDQRRVIRRLGAMRSLLVVISLLLTCTGRLINDPNGYMFLFATWIAVVLVGYGIPEAFLCSYRAYKWAQSSGDPNWKKAISALVKYVSTGKIPDTPADSC